MGPKILEQLRRIGWLNLLFVAVVILPTFFASLFYGLIASKRYASEVQFIVRSTATQRTTGLDIFFRTFGLSRTVDDGYAVQRYLQSRDAVRALDALHNLRNVFSPSEADYLSRYPFIFRADSFESLYDYYLQRVTVSEDSVKGIIQLKVIAFRPRDAKNLADSLLSLAEQMVNRMNDRAQADAIQSARQALTEAEQHVLAAQGAVTAFRNQEILVDPSQASVSLIELIGTLSADLNNATVQLHELEATSPSSPALSSVRSRVKSLQERIAGERSKLAGGADALASKIAEFEQLALKRDIADKTLVASLNALDAAQREARRKHIYVEAVSSANLPDASTEPQRLRNILTVFVFGISGFCVAWILSVGAGEHSQ